MNRRFELLAVGEINIDLILSGLPRVPEFGTEVLASVMSLHLGGATANFAIFARRLGLRTAFVTYTGTIDSVRATDVAQDLLAACHHLYMSSFFLQSKLGEGLVELITRARAAGLTTSIDPGYDTSADENGHQS